LSFANILETPLTGRFSLWQLRYWVGALLLALSWLATEHFLPWVSWHSEALCFLAVMLMAWLGWGAAHARPHAKAIAVPFPALLFIMFGLLALLQWACGLMTFGGDVIVVWLYIGLCVACLTIGFNVGRLRNADQESQRWSPLQILALALVVASTVSVFLALAQVFELWEQSPWIVRMMALRRPGANLAQPNQLATLLVMGAASAAFLHVTGRLSAWTAGLLLLLVCGGVAATESRSGALGLSGLLIWWQLKRLRVAPHVPRWAGPALALIFLSFFMAWPHLLNEMQSLQERSASNRFAQGDVRWNVWQQLFDAILQRPWSGWGILQVAEAHNGVAAGSTVSNPLSFSHNILIDWAVWMGLPIAAALAAITGVWLWRRVPHVQNSTAWYCLGILVPLAVHSMLEFPYAYAYFLAPALFGVGVLDGQRGDRPLIHVGSTTMGLLLLGLSAASLWSAVEYLAIEEDFRVVRFEQLRIGHTPGDYQRPGINGLTQLEALLTASRIELRSGLGPQEIDQLRKVALRYPWVATQYRYALALALNGERQEAIRQFQVIRRQRDEKLYQRIKTELGELAQGRYPQLRGLVLP
jgi:hypothetical protein